MKRSSARRTAGSVFVAFCLLAVTVVAVPVTAAAADASAPAGVSPADAPLASTPLPLPLTPVERVPATAVDDLSGIPVDQVQVTIPADQTALAPTDVTASLQALPADSAPSTDVFGTGPDAASHVALVYADDVNKANGS